MAIEKTIKIKVDSSGAKKSVDSLDQSVDKLDRTAGRTNKSFGNLKGAVIAVAAALQVRVIAQYADAFSSIQNQIRQTTKTTQELTQRTSDLLGVANRSRVEFAETSNLYTQLNLSTANLNLSTGDLLRLTETISKSFSISGKTAAESAGSIRQLGQAFAAGVLRGDEFNSIAENAPEIMRALQRSLGLTQGELRDLAATGGITSEILVNALGEAAEVVDEKMSKSTRTLAQAFQEANNNAIAFVGSSDFVSNAMSGAGDAVVFLSQNLGVMSASFSAFDGIASDVTNSFAQMKSEISGLGDTTFSITQAFSDMPNNIRAFIKISVIEVLSFFKFIASEAEFFKEKIEAIFSDDTIENVEKRRIEAQKILSGLREASLEDILAERDAAINSADAQIEKAKELRDVVDAPAAPAKVVRVTPQAVKKDAFTNNERFKTESLKLELQERLELQRAFNATIVDENATTFEMERAIADFNRMSDLAGLERKKQDSAIAFAQEREQIMANEKLKGEERLIILAELQEQELLQKEIFEADKTAIEQDAAEQRAEITRKEEQVKRQIQDGAFDAAISGLSLFGSKSEKVQKKFMIINAIRKGYSAAVAAWDAGMSTGGPWAPAVAAAYTAASLAQTGSLISSIKGSGGGGGISGGGSPPTAAAQSPQRQEPLQQSFVVENRGLSEVLEELKRRDPQEPIPLEYALRIAASQDELQRLGGR